MQHFQGSREARFHKKNQPLLTYADAQSGSILATWGAWQSQKNDQSRGNQPSTMGQVEQDAIFSPSNKYTAFTASLKYPKSEESVSVAR